MWGFPYLVVGALVGAFIGVLTQPTLLVQPGEYVTWPLWWALGGLVIGLICDLCDPLKRERLPRPRWKRRRNIDE